MLQAELGDNLLAMALFGSVARGHGGPLSDLDLLIVHRGPREAALDRFLPVTRELREGPEYKRLVAEGFLPDPYPVFLSMAGIRCGFQHAAWLELRTANG